MVQLNPAVRNQLKLLRKISYGMVKHRSAGVIDIEIGQLKPHDCARALHVSTNAFAELAYKQQMISKVIHQSQEDIKKVLNNDKLTRKQLIDAIKEIVLDPDLEKSSSKPSPSQERGS